MAPVDLKKQEAGKLNKRCLALDEKIKILEENKEKKLKIFKARVSNTLDKHHQKFKLINEILYAWFRKCESSGIYVNGPLLKEEAMNIKQSLNRPELDGFKASEGWLDKWKLSHGIREKQISGESLDVPLTTIESWMERIKELCSGYDDKDILNMDESGCFFKALPTKGLAQKQKKSKGGKKSKQRITVAFFVSADGKNCLLYTSPSPRDS